MKEKIDNIANESRLFIEGPIRRGELNLFVLPIEHTEREWNKSSEDIKSAIERFPTIIPEYFPPEYRHLESSDIPLIGNFLGNMFKKYKSSNFLFEGIAKHAFKNKKDIFVLDPAYDMSFAYFRLLLNSGGSALSLSLVLALKTAHEKLKKIEKANSQITRRKFLHIGTKIAGIFLLSSSFGAIGTLSDDSTETIMGSGALVLKDSVEDDFRAAVIADAIIKLSDHLENETNALLIYPPEHWKNIKKYLENDLKRKETLDRYSFLRSIDIFKSMFYARKYPGGNLGNRQTLLL